MTADEQPPVAGDESPSSTDVDGAPSETPPGPISRVSRPKGAAREWYDRISERYDTFADPFEAPARTAGIDLLDAQPGECVLDVGCGTGTALVALSRAVGADGTAVGIDLADGMTRVSRGALADAGLDYGVVVLGDAATLPFEDDAFDALFVSFVLELFDTPEMLAVLTEWQRVLAPGGRLCVVSLSRRGDGPATWLYESVHTLIPTHVDCRPIYARDTLREAGFRIDDTREATVWVFPVEIVRCRLES
ncbi:class I SAM-dependent methyltransferase [Natronorubrum thiooxidans]|uniref:Demethylmenaquinone methyltransferase / 2-methoxy-6-polyprenyl-1,4-benzoquinol methylase n=1 Tax=Natronorubrum thiooxidans TaxID=308853 RepID=A0A1N7DKP2_9EURY|nr:methyltransferase domain-containing protein [Natronorubrum thiooxidans]SIR76315.1 demethylmenaquinone methyltransferase / 2-methoxy-6-polyprenyl-1,4-benzoquinol methylase [Natronorubrum thiooxidans]